MTKYLVGLIGLALLGGSPLLGQAAPCGGELRRRLRKRAATPVTTAVRTAAARSFPSATFTASRKRSRSTNIAASAKKFAFPAAAAARSVAAASATAANPATMVARRAAGCKCKVREVNRLVIHPVHEGSGRPQVHRGVGLPALQQLRPMWTVRGARRAQRGPSSPVVAEGPAAAEDGGHGPFAPGFQRGVL